MRVPPRRVRTAGLLALVPALALGAQRPVVDSAGLLTVDRVFRRGEFATPAIPPVQWGRDGASLITLRPTARGADLVRVRLPAGDTVVLARADRLVDERGAPLDIEEVVLSPDESRALLFHSSVRVWRTNSRGRYHVLDLATGRLTPLVRDRAPMPLAGPAAPAGRPADGRPSFLAAGLASGAADPDLQMYARFSPDGRAVAYVRANDLWVTELATGTTRRLTTDGSDDVLNGVGDWVHEEEFGLADAVRWSPDGRRLLYWRFDQSAVPAVPIVDELPRYPSVATLRYPKAGAPNARVTLHVVPVEGGPARSLAVGPDTGQYLPRADWVDADSLSIVRLPRRQDRLELLLVSATTGTGRVVLTDADSAYVDVEGEPVRWLAGGRELLLRSDRSGWRQWYLYDRAGRRLRQVTRDGHDVLDLVGLDEGARALYATVAAPTPRDEQLWRFSLDGTAPPRRLSQAPGAHELSIAPGGRYAQLASSRLDRPWLVQLVTLPDLTPVAMRVDTAPALARLAAARLGAATFFTIPLADGTTLDAYRIVPPGFDSTRAHPLVLHTYGGPAAPQVVDRWSPRHFLFHQMLAQRGYVVVVVDPRGAAWRGRAFRKGTQYQLGLPESDDLIAAVQWLGERPWVDRARVGMWGWSYGGFLTALTTARGGTLFKAGIVVAPVTDWRFYDSIYTERYLWTPQENGEGYARSTPLAYAGRMRARLLLVHGTGDDNVHVQNTLALSDALVAAGKPFEMLLYPNRTHAIAGGPTTAHLYDAFLRFWLERL